MRKRAVLATAGFLLAGLVALLTRRVPPLPPGTAQTIARIRTNPLTGVIPGTSGYAQSGEVRIWYESIPAVGSEKGVVLLNSSLGVGSLFWPPSFLRALTAEGYRVVRYDHRGTGASSWMKGWDRKHPYSLVEMANDAVTVLEELRLERVHMLGLSLGGFVA
nr:alpha/beta fold hydrolase [uncultured Arthrobacter sp.]